MPKQTVTMTYHRGYAQRYAPPKAISGLLFRVNSIPKDRAYLDTDPERPVVTGESPGWDGVQWNPCLDLPAHLPRWGGGGLPS